MRTRVRANVAVHASACLAQVGTPVEGQYIRIALANNKPLVLAEVQAFTGEFLQKCMVGPAPRRFFGGVVPVRARCLRKPRC